MPDLLETWRDTEEAYSGDVPDEVYDETYIDTPDCENLTITWCPMYSRIDIEAEVDEFFATVPFRTKKLFANQAEGE